jgi:hypothetical protein
MRPISNRIRRLERTLAEPMLEEGESAADILRRAGGAAWKRPAYPLWRSHGYAGRLLSVEGSRSLTFYRGATPITPHLREHVSEQKRPKTYVPFALVKTDPTFEKMVLMLSATPGMIAPAATATKPAIKAYSMRS